jgi:hypothetical protein
MAETEDIKRALSVSAWEVREYGGSNLYFETLCEHAEDGLLHGSLELEHESDLEKLDAEHLAAVMGKLREFHEKAFWYLQSIGSDEKDEDGEPPAFSDIIFYPNGGFSLGFDFGETEGGRMFVYVKFTENFEISDDIIYELY